jgi:membrane protease YdiL (CAAX protease family)
MAAWIESAFGAAGRTTGLVYLELALAFALLATVLHFRRRRGTRDELKAVLAYFASFFALVLAAPVLIVVLTAARPAPALSTFGWTFGRAGLGALLTLGGLPLVVLAAWAGSRDPAMQTMYPLAKAACDGPGRFAGYELAYLGLYYLPWESAFRGALFLPLVPAIGLVPALAIQTGISTLLHIGHPEAEIFAAAGAGLAFGLIAYATGSFFYPLVLHAATGIATDTFLFARRRRRLP